MISANATRTGQLNAVSYDINRHQVTVVSASNVLCKESYGVFVCVKLLKPLRINDE